MSGLPNFNTPLFMATAQKWRDAGYFVQNPVELGGLDQSKDWRTYMIVDLTVIMLACDAIAVIPGWEASKGARVEMMIARAFGLEIYDAETFELINPKISLCIEGAEELELK